MPTPVLNPNGISTGSAVFAGLTSVPYRQTDIPRYSIGNNRLHISFYSARNARIASAVLATAIPSVCLPVRHMPLLRQNDGT